MSVALDPDIPVWPRFLAPESIAHGPTRPILTGPQPLSGRPQSVLSDMGAWHVAMTNILLDDEYDTVRLLRALLFGTLAQGQPVYVPFFDWRRAPRARVGLPVLSAPVPFQSLAGETFFSDSTGFVSGSPNILVSQPASARATALAVNPEDGGEPIPAAGEFFGLGERIHVVRAVLPDTPGSGQTTLKIWPPLRSAAVVGDVLETRDPVCRMLLDPKQVETLITITSPGYGIVGRVSLDFYEANWT